MKQPEYTAIVWWLDAWGESGERVTHRKQTPWKRMTSGLLAQDDEDGVCLYGTFDPVDNKFEDRTFIPRGMVVRMRKFRIPYGRKP